MRLTTSYLLFFTLFFTRVFAQDSTVIVSQPLDISQEGTNKIIQLKNGNTMLLHFVNGNRLTVMMFDKTGKLFATERPDTKELHTGRLTNTVFKGLTTCNDDAVLFLSQTIDNVETMVRLVFDGGSGELKNEQILVQSKSMANTTWGYVVKATQGYAIVTYNNKPTKEGVPDSLHITVTRYNADNVPTETITYAHNKEFDHQYGFNISSTDDGNIMLALKDATKLSIGSQLKVRLMYLRNDMHGFVVRDFGLPENVTFSGIKFRKNEFAGNLNVVLLMSHTLRRKEGLATRYFDKKQQYVLIMPEDLSEIKNTTFTAISSMDSITNTDASYWLLQYNTNNLGVSTAVHMNINPLLTYNGYEWEEYKEIIVSRYDDNGVLLSEATIPHWHETTKDGTPGILGIFITKKILFSSIEVITAKSTFLLFNDVAENSAVRNQSLVKHVVNFDSTNAVVCTVNKKGLYRREDFFPADNEQSFRQIYPLSEHFDEQQKRIAVLMRKKKGKQETLHVAWRRLED